jgi:hypothetical protein
MTTDTDTDTAVLPVVTDTADGHGDLPAALEAAAPRRWWNRATPVLLGLLLIAGGFLGGVAVQKEWGSQAASATVQPQAGTRMPGGGGPSGAPRERGGPAAAPSTTGTLTAVDGAALTVRTADGRTVNVKIVETTRVRRTAPLTTLTTGRAVTVEGSTATDGTITATEVTAD